MTRLLSIVAALLIPHAAALAAPPAVSAVAYHPNGKVVAFGAGSEVRLFDTATGAAGRQYTGPGKVTALAFDPTGNWLATGHSESGKAGTVFVHSVGEQAELHRRWKAHADAVYALAFAPNGKTLASAGYDRVIRVWDVRPDELGAKKSDALDTPRRELKDHSDTVHGLAFHPDGKLLASASADRTVKVWDADTGQRLYTLGDATDWLYCLAWSPDGKRLAAGGVDKSLRVWEADRDGGKLALAAFAHERPVWRLGYTSDGETLYSVGEDRVITAWDAAKLSESKVLPAQAEAVLAFAVRPDGKQLAVGLFDGSGLLVDSATGKATAQPLPAKPVPPKPEKLTPSAAVRGATTKVTITGKGLDQATKVTASSPDVAATVGTRSANAIELELRIAPTAAVGAVQLVFEGEAGKSAPMQLIIDRYSAIPEAGVTDSSRAAQVVTLPVTVAGSIDRAGDADFYRFEAKAGQQVGVQVVATEIGSKLDAVLVFTDASGQVLAEGNTTLGFTVPKAGTYAVAIRDREFRGAADMPYRLHVGDVPVVTGVFPLAVQRGKAARVHLDGVHLGPLAGQPVTVNVPTDAALGSRVPVPLTMAGEKPLGSPAVTVDEFAAAVVDPVAGGELRVPGSADGVLASPGAGQAVRFAAKKGERLIVEVLARRAGSPVDPVLELLDAAGKPLPRATLRATSKTYVVFRDHDSAATGIRFETWADLTINDYLYVDGELMRIFNLPKNPDDDCQFYAVAGQRVGFLDTTPAHHAQGTPMYKVELHPPGRTFPPNGLPTFPLVYRNDDGGPGYGKDSRIVFDCPADGVYQARVTDARGAGGPTHAYRVTVRPPRPDYSVTFTPTAPAVWKGGAIPISVNATRTDGFDGPIRVKLEGLPPGFSAPETFIEGNQNSTAFALYAAADATVPPNTLLKLKATATINGKDVVHEAAGGLPKTIDPGDIVTTTRQDSIVIKPGQETRLVVDIERRGDFKGRIPLDVRGLPHGVRVLDIGLNGILITERDKSREIVIYADPWVQAMEVPLVVLARSERKGTEHAAKSVLLKIEK